MDVRWHIARQAAKRGIRLGFEPPAALSAPLAIGLDFVAAYLQTTRQHVGFVQIGAFDGLTNDPLHEAVLRYGWRGVLVEPQPEAFARLTANYAGTNGLVFLNAAVGAERGARDLWCFPQDGPAPDWARQLASFDRAVIAKHLNDRPELMNELTTIRVESLTLTDVFAAAPAGVDVLQIDAEGFDAEIVRMVDFEHEPPQVIRFEHRHLRRSDHSDVAALLVAHGYRLAVGEDDTLAMRYRPAVGSTAVY